MLFRRFFKNVPWKVSAINFLLNVMRSLSTSLWGLLVGFFVVLLFFWLCWVFVAGCRLSSPTACGILVPPPGISLASSAFEDRFLTTGSQWNPCKAVFKFWLCHLLIECTLSSALNFDTLFLDLENRRNWLSWKITGSVRPSVIILSDIIWL